MNVHIVWAQGWDLAPPKALRNAEAWEQIGEVHRWSERTAIDSDLFEQNSRAAEQQIGKTSEHQNIKTAALPFCGSDALALAQAPAMKADMILAAAMLSMGGLAVGADMCPVDVSALSKALSEAEARNLGLAVYQSYRDEPYSGGSYFPAGNAWISLVHQQQLAGVRMHGGSKSVSAVTGPAMWRLLMRKHPGVWFSSVRTVPAWIAFTCEPKTRGSYRHAWIDPGLTGDWLGARKGAWL